MVKVDLRDAASGLLAVAGCAVLSLGFTACGSTSKGAANSPAASTSTGASKASNGSAPANGTVLTTLESQGVVSVVANLGGEGFSAVDDASSPTYPPGPDESSVTTYSTTGEMLTKLPSRDLTGECGAADLTVPGVGRIIITELITTHPAQGIEPSMSEAALKAWNANTGAAVWSATITPLAARSEPPSCAENMPEEVPEATTLHRFANTTNREWALSTAGTDPYVVNLKTGAIRADPLASGVLGDYIVQRASSNATGYLTDPNTGRDAPLRTARRRTVPDPIRPPGSTRSAVITKVRRGPQSSSRV